LQSRRKSDRKAEESDREARAKVSSPVKGYTVPYIILYIIYPFAWIAPILTYQALLALLRRKLGAKWSVLSKGIYNV
jgi:hypothetical protein